MGTQYIFEFTDTARSNLKDLDRQIAIRILKKLKFWESSPNPLQFADTLTNFKNGKIKFRIGNYRLICIIRKVGVLTVILIKHRSKVYEE